MVQKKEENFYGIRLKAARKMAGLSMDDLVNKMGIHVSKQAISKYETGKMKPDSKILLHLSKVLGVKLEYLFRTSKIELSELHFRKKSNLPEKVEESLKYKAIDLLERYTELEQMLGFSIQFQNPFEDFILKSQNDIETAADKLRKNWNLGISPIMNLLELLEEKGIKIFYIGNLPGFDGLYAKINDAFVIVLNKDLPPDRIRFTAAHELAHILFDFSQKSDKEKLCHSFAGAFLLPKEILEKELIKKRNHITVWELCTLKENYGISMQAIMKRALNLGIISKYHLRNFKKHINERGWNKKEPVEYKGKEEPIRFKQLLNYAVSEDLISLGKAAELDNLSISEFRRKYFSEL